MKQGFGFIYLWKDMKRNKYYLGSHLGDLNDGYIGSNNRLQYVFKSRASTLRRRILEKHQNITSKDLLIREQAWLQLIKVEELGNKYYNEKRVAAGGDIISELSEEKKKQHREKSIAARRRGHLKWCQNNPDKVKENAKYARSKVKNPNGGSMPGDLNPAKRDDVRLKISEAAKKREAERKEKGIKVNERTYKIIFISGEEEIIIGQRAIKSKYCANFSIKFERFIDTDEPVKSNRKAAKTNLLLGAIIKTVKNEKI